MKISKRIISLFLVMVLFFGILPISTFAAGNIMYGIGFVDADTLRLRSKPNTTSSIVDVALDKECVVVVSKSGDWYQVNYNLQVGYMHKDYLNVLTCENAELGYGEVNTANVNLRNGPSTTYTRTAVASKGDKCYILGLNQGWYKVIYNNRICYIRSDFLNLTEIPYENKDSAKSPMFFRHGKSTGIVPSAAALNGTSASGSTASMAARTIASASLRRSWFIRSPHSKASGSP